MRRDRTHEEEPPRALATLVEASRALARFDPLAALKLVGLREDAHALAVRGIALAQLGEYAKARALVDRAARALDDGVARARCFAASGEIALAQRDLSAAGRSLAIAAKALDAHGDVANALFVRLQLVKRLVLLGDVEGAHAALGKLDLRRAPARIRAVAALARTDIEMRALRPKAARAALDAARVAAREASETTGGVLADEVERAARELAAPVARIVSLGEERAALLDDIAALTRSRDLIVDACRREVRGAKLVVPLVKRPVLLALAVALGRHAPESATRETLAEEAFGARRVSASLRARLRVEIGRVRQALATLADIDATEGGYALRPRHGARVIVLLPPAPGEASALLALLRAGESWSTSALATALGSTQRTVQRALAALREEGRVESVGRARAQRWIARPPEGFATNLLLVPRPPAS